MPANVIDDVQQFEALPFFICCPPHITLALATLYEVFQSHKVDAQDLFYHTVEVTALRQYVCTLRTLFDLPMIEHNKRKVVVCGKSAIMVVKQKPYMAAGGQSNAHGTIRQSTLAVGEKPWKKTRNELRIVENRLCVIGMPVCHDGATFS